MFAARIDRRGFIRNLVGLGVFSILPGAGRIWKATKPIGVYQWITNQRHSVCYNDDYAEVFLNSIHNARGKAWDIETICDERTKALMEKLLFNR